MPVIIHAFIIIKAVKRHKGVTWHMSNCDTCEIILEEAYIRASQHNAYELKITIHNEEQCGQLIFVHVSVAQMSIVLCVIFL